ncbi:hypothetical protein HDU87_006673 [Geranomyces variabilis]|uniref:Uncharacterized protein n=1 Tax=Geranomyces variabilis TaxID=109894 RepID=A0AAD5TGL6_9FUNG|nr:hypothetical protein HDU87_006673 [Geranomyces variabilis]
MSMAVALLTSAQRLAFRIQVAEAGYSVLKFRIAVAVLRLHIRKAAADEDFTQASLLDKRSDAMLDLLVAANQEHDHLLRVLQNVDSSLAPLVQAEDQVAFTKQELYCLIKAQDDCSAFLMETVQDVITEDDRKFCRDCWDVQFKRSTQKFFDACHQPDSSARLAVKAPVVLLQQHKTILSANRASISL